MKHKYNICGKQNYTWAAMQKLVFGYMLTVIDQISLCSLAVWTEPSLPANIIIEFYRMYDGEQNPW